MDILIDTITQGCPPTPSSHGSCRPIDEYPSALRVPCTCGIYIYIYIYLHLHILLHITTTEHHHTVQVAQVQVQYSRQWMDGKAPLAQDAEGDTTMCASGQRSGHKVQWSGPASVLVGTGCSNNMQSTTTTTTDHADMTNTAQCSNQCNLCEVPPFTLQA